MSFWLYPNLYKCEFGLWGQPCSTSLFGWPAWLVRAKSEFFKDMDMARVHCPYRDLDLLEVKFLRQLRIERLYYGLSSLVIFLSWFWVKGNTTLVVWISHEYRWKKGNCPKSALCQKSTLLCDENEQRGKKRLQVPIILFSILASGRGEWHEDSSENIITTFIPIY